jgi:hypothetical protein
MSPLNTKDQVVQKIKSKGYWEVNIRPVAYSEQRVEKRNLKELVRSSKVELRGWDYPHFRDSGGEPYPIQTGIEKFIDWSNNIEFWRMTQSANFFHLLALEEDWMELADSMYISRHHLKNQKWLGVLGTLYTLTEMFEFARRLALHNIFDDSMIIDIKLTGLENRKLLVESFDRVPLYDKVAKVSDPWEFKKEILVADVLSKSAQFALEAFADLVFLFNWVNVPIDSMKNDQQKFLQGRI